MTEHLADGSRGAIGIDFGGTEIKGSSVDLRTGSLTGRRGLRPTPSVASPANVVPVVQDLLRDHPDTGTPVGVAVPSVVRENILRSAANIDMSWLDVDAAETFRSATGRRVAVLNDADAAGLAELAYGSPSIRSGLTIVVTLGTGIGSALLSDGRLVPNSELGHLQLDGQDAEQYASNSARVRGELSWESWADRLTVYFRHLEELFSPDLFVVGGGVTAVAEKFLPLVHVETELVPATLRNDAGIVGAALHARDTAT